MPEIMTGLNTDYQNIYLCGECYFSQKLRAFLGNNLNYAIHDLSFGSGNTDSFLSVLKYKKYLDPGLFFLGGSIHDKYGWRDGQALYDVLKWFECSLYESELVLCLTGPFTRTNSDFDHRTVNAFKERFAKENGLKILDLRIGEENTVDYLHFDLAGEKIFFHRVLDFISQYSRAKQSMVLKTVDMEIDVFDVPDCKRLTILHDVPDHPFYIHNNESLVKQMAPFRLINEHRDHVHFLTGRKMYNNLWDVKSGNVRFSEKAFVYSLILHF